MAMKARETLGDDPELVQILGQIRYQKKEFVHAIQLLQASARAKPLDANGLYYLGMSQMQTKQKPEALEALNRALAAGLADAQAAEAKRAVAELQRR